MANLIVRPSAWNQIPADQRELYQRQWQLLTQLLDEHKEWQAKKAAAAPGSPEFKKASKKVSNYPRWIADALQAPPETFADIDLSRGKAGPDLHDMARRLMGKSTSTGGTMHHITAIMQTQGAWKGLNMAGIYEQNQRLKELGIALGTQDPNLVEVPNTKHQLHMDKHATTSAGKTDWANKPWRVEDTKDWASIEARVEAIRQSDAASRAANTASEATDWAKEYRQRLSEPVRLVYGEEIAQKFAAGQADPLLRNPVINQLGIDLNTELNKQGIITPDGSLDAKAFNQIQADVASGSPSTAKSKRLLKIVEQGRDVIANNPLKIGAASYLAGSLLPKAAQALPFAGSGIEAAMGPSNQASYEKEIQENPDDKLLPIAKHASWWGQQSAGASLAGMTAMGTGASLMMNPDTFGAGVATTLGGLAISAPAETVNLTANATELGIQGIRQGVKWWNNTKERAEEIKQEQSTAKQLSVGFAGAT